MNREEASLRAKIAAMKNLLAVQSRKKSPYSAANPYSNTNSCYARPSSYKRSHKAYRQNQSSSQFHQPITKFSQNKTWSREGYSHTNEKPASKENTSLGASIIPSLSLENSWKISNRRRTGSQKSNHLRSLMVKRAREKMRLQRLKLEDGEYHKINGGFKLVRSGITDTQKSAAASLPKDDKQMISLGGVNYTLANGVIKTNEDTKYEPQSFKLTIDPKKYTMSRKKMTASSRAKTVVQSARKGKTKTNQVRTEYCLFFNRFGYCKSKNDCKYIHDSRKVAVCRKFLKGECNDSKCLLSHKIDQNKMPVCTLFLRGECTKDDCEYRHVKVSGSAQVCEDFLKGYCPKGSSCTLKHTLPQKKRSLESPKKVQQESDAHPPKQAKVSDGAGKETLKSLLPGKSGDVGSGSNASQMNSRTNDEIDGILLSNEGSFSNKLSIRPRFKFAPKHKGIIPFHEEDTA